jgi:mannose-1-phosphate guanylyltransferase
MAIAVQPVVLAGGAGTRLWPISTEKRPKHLLPIVGSPTMLAQTLERVGDAALFRQPIIVGAAAQAEEIADIAPEAALILEPCPRGSAAAVAFAALSVPEDAVLLVLPSDHHVTDAAPLIEAILRGLPAAQSGRLVTFGIHPSHAETGYGYIVGGAAIEEGVLDADSFVEKPAKEVAEELIRTGNAFWNSGMFMFSAAAFLDELRRHAPQIYEATTVAFARARHDGRTIAPDGNALQNCPSTSIDYAVMEHSDRIAVIPIELDWSDVGSWAAVYDLGVKDADGNLVSDNSRAIDSRGCLIRSDGPSIVAIGVEDLVIIATEDHVLIVPRSEAQRVREAAEALKRP